MNTLVQEESFGKASLLSYYQSSMNDWSEGQQEYSKSQTHRQRSLTHYKNCGANFNRIRDGLQGASKLNPIDSDMGTFTSFAHFLSCHEEHSGSGLSRSHIRRFMRLADHWDVVEDLKLNEREACYRLHVTLSIISWGLKKREQGYKLKELDHKLYWEEKENQSPKPEQGSKPTYAQLEKKVDELTYKLEELTDKLQESNQEVLRLRRQLSLEESFALLPAEPGRL